MVARLLDVTEQMIQIQLVCMVSKNESNYKLKTLNNMGKYIKVFETSADYQQFMGGGKYPYLTCHM